MSVIRIACKRTHEKNTRNWIIFGNFNTRQGKNCCKMNTNECWVANPEIILEKEDDGVLLFNPDTGEIKILNETGAFFYERLDGKTPVKDVIKELCAIFDGITRDEAEKDIADLLEELIKYKLVAQNSDI